MKVLGMWEALVDSIVCSNLPGALARFLSLPVSITEAMLPVLAGREPLCIPLVSEMLRGADCSALSLHLEYFSGI